MPSASRAFISTGKIHPYSNLEIKNTNIEEISISEMKKRIHNTEQAYFKEAFEQRNHSYFMSLSEGGSWPAWLKSRGAGIRTDRTGSRQASLCPPRPRSTAASRARMPREEKGLHHYEQDKIWLQLQSYSWQY